ncbi:sensor domain-containing protein [Mycobacterium sp. 050134]|uniref:sensor domain-containing protein n=1 Tax=Mycobacterium sp. 050134 TaxID=3096111 RepID=UPI002EDA96FB
MGMPPGGHPHSPRRPVWRWWLAGAAVVIAAVLVLTLDVLGRNDAATKSSTGPSSITQPPAAAGPAQTSATPSATAAGPALDAGTLPGLLATAEQVGKVLNNAPMNAREVETSPASGVSMDPAACSSAVAPVLDSTYATSGYTGMAAQGLEEAKPGRHKVIQGVVAFPDSTAAQRFYEQQLSAWHGCRLKEVTVSYNNGQPDDHAKVTVVTDSGGTATTVLLPADPTQHKGSECERSMSARRNVVVDVRACGQNTMTAAFLLVRGIDDNITSHP